MWDVSVIFQLLAESRIGEVLFLTLILGTARPLAFVMVTPLFTRFGLQEGLIRTTILLAFAAPVLPGLYVDLAASPSLGTGALIALISKELMIGLILALLLGVPLWAVAAAGDMVDMQRGAMMSDMVDPGSGDATTPTGTLFFLMAAFLLVSNGWFTEVVLATLFDTYILWPILAPLPAFDPVAAWQALGVLDDLVRLGVILAMPLISAMFLADITLAIALKYTQQINAMFMGMSVKQGVFVLLLPVYFASMMYFFSGEIKDLGGLTEDMRGFFSTDARLPQ